MAAWRHAINNLQAQQPRTVHSSGLGLWSDPFLYLAAVFGLLPWLSGRPADKGPSVWHTVRLWCVDSTHFSTSAVSTLMSGLLLVGVEAACLHTLAGFWSYNFMPIKQRANWPATLGVCMLPTPLEWCMKHLVSCGQFWRCLLHFPVQQPQFSNTQTHTRLAGHYLWHTDSVWVFWWVFKCIFVSEQEKSRKATISVSLACGSCTGLLPSLNNQVFILLSVVFFPVRVENNLTLLRFLMYKTWLSRGKQHALIIAATNIS